ncbi:carboxypeptidase B-like isoform X2 [Pomacea canaliculata]|uniref:carboxypeptidase B-like isoform X2 n=1 Tax=Pomacea canaliculata TaxID=400727 RepID=UPI000D734D7B|nr:carboxypeptidase B-like isoform X2 [Pomacea canaliculata]
MERQVKLLMLCGLTLLLTTGVRCRTAARRSDEGIPSYVGYKVLRVTSRSREALSRTLRHFEKQQGDVWSHLPYSASVMFPREQVEEAIRIAKKEGLGISVILDDVQRYLDANHRKRHERRKRAATVDVTNSYLGLDEINAFLQNVTRSASAADVISSTIGLSFEGRNTPVIEIRERNTKSSGTQKKAIIIDAGIHAREWIAPALALNIINKLAFNPDNDPDVLDLLKKFDWIIAPVVNPDGYEYSRTNSGARLWRKTRTSQYSESCKGVDANRNFGFGWDPDVGGSREPCSDVFSGNIAFSEPEARNMRDWLQRNKGRAAAYLTLHSYGQYVLYPYGTCDNRVADNKDILEDLGKTFANALGQKGRRYSVGNSCQVLYPAAGGSDDYAKGSLGIPVAYTIELSPGEKNFFFGFDLPESEIASTVADTWFGLKLMVQRLYQLYSGSNSAGSQTPRTGSSAQSASQTQLVPVVINGITYYFNSSDPNTQQWLTAYRSLSG